MREGTPRTVFLKDYQPPAFLIDTADLDIDLREDEALVRAVLTVRRNRACAGKAIACMAMRHVGCGRRRTPGEPAAP